MRNCNFKETTLESPILSESSLELFKRFHLHYYKVYNSYTLKEYCKYILKINREKSTNKLKENYE